MACCTRVLYDFKCEEKLEEEKSTIKRGERRGGGGELEERKV
jgi:hypothetical protein